MKKVLVIQFRKRPEMIAAEQEEYRRAIGDRALIDFQSAFNDDLEWSEPQNILAEYDGLILGGSGEFDLHGGRTDDDPARATAREVLARLESFVKYLSEATVPVLAICFGHQLIAETHGGNVTNDHMQKKVGTYKVQLTDAGKADPLFSLLSETFVAQYGHKDSVTSMPHGGTLLAVGPACKFSAVRYRPKMYSTQFHPELTAKDVMWKLANSPGYLPEGVSVESMVKESPDASKIIPLWIERVVEAVWPVSRGPRAYFGSL